MSKRILITGGAGMIGRHLSKRLSEKGYEPVILSRHPDEKAVPKQFHWNHENGTIDEEALKDIYGVVHLAGAGVADKRWTASRKKEIFSSRVDTTNFLESLIESGKLKPQIFVCSSGVNYYADKADQWLKEDEPPAKGSFLADVCIAWEENAFKIKKHGLKVAVVRTGIVLSRDGGALEKIDKPIKMGLGAYLGNGKQFYPWIHIADMAGIYMHILENQLEGVYNASAPNPVTNKEIVKTIADVLDKPNILAPTPKFILHIALGEMAEMVLCSLRVSSEKIQQSGYKFEYEHVKNAFESLYQKG